MMSTCVAGPWEEKSISETEWKWRSASSTFAPVRSRVTRYAEAVTDEDR